MITRVIKTLTLLVFLILALAGGASALLLPFPYSLAPIILGAENLGAAIFLFIKDREEWEKISRKEKLILSLQGENISLKQRFQALLLNLGVLLKSRNSDAELKEIYSAFVRK